MNKAISTILKIAGGFWLLQLLTSNAASSITSRLTVGKPRLDSTNSIFTPPVMQLRLLLPVQNTSALAITIDGFSGALVYGQFPLTDILLTQPITIPASGDVNIPITLAVPYERLSNQIVQIINSGQFLAGLRIEGILSSGGLNIQIEEPIINL